MAAKPVHVLKKQTNTQHHFKAPIYKSGINYCVDVPIEITDKLTAVKGYIKVEGRINHFKFEKALVPVKDKPYRLFVNLTMMKGANTALGEIAAFKIEQDKSPVVKEYSAPDLLIELLEKNGVAEDFNNLTPARKQNIFKYLSYIKTDETLQLNIDKLIFQLRNKEKNVRIP